MRSPFLFYGDGDYPKTLGAAIELGFPFLFTKPVTLASAFLHHELQRRPETNQLLAPLLPADGFDHVKIAEYWHNLDQDKAGIAKSGYCRIDNPGARYAGLHRETFSDASATGATVATFVKPLIVRGVLHRRRHLDPGHFRSKLGETTTPCLRCL
jgi:hypothetical protein